MPANTIPTSNYVVLHSSRAEEPIIIPPHLNQVTGAAYPGETLLNGASPIDAYGAVTKSLDGSLFVLSGEWNGDQIMGLSGLSVLDGTDGHIYTHSEVLALLASSVWSDNTETSQSGEE
jgi:hypothetical protein